MTVKQKILSFWLFGLLLSGLACIGLQLRWDSSAAFHTLMESGATLLALFVGAMSLIRHYSHREGKYLLVGVGFIGTAMIDGFHTAITSTWFHPVFPSELEALIPWSWLPSRLFLAVMLMLSVFRWTPCQFLAKLTGAGERNLYVLVIAVIGSIFFYLSFHPLPPAYFSDRLISRPEELLPLVFFTLALLGYLREGSWRSVDIDYWMVLALIASVFSQAGFMAFSRHLFDQQFDIAHALKQLSYLFVLTGLLTSTFKAFEQLDQEILQHRLAENKNRILVAAIEKSPVAVVVTDADANIDYCNPKALSMLGYEAEEVLGKNPRIFSAGQTTQQTYTSMWEMLNKGKEWQGTFYNRKRNGDPLIEESHISPIMDEHQRITHFVAINFDVTERMRIEQDTWYKANYDLLTRLPNRGLFLDRAENALRNAKRAGLPLAILFIDLDGFKPVNDNHGHGMGDALLQEIGSRISKSIRESDTVARFGGDEFGILLTDFKDRNEAGRVAKKVLAAVNKPCTINDVRLQISASIGIALFPTDGEDVTSLLTNADIAMYRVKKSVGNNTGFYLPA